MLLRSPSGTSGAFPARVEVASRALGTGAGGGRGGEGESGTGVKREMLFHHSERFPRAARREAVKDEKETWGACKMTNVDLPVAEKNLTLINWKKVEGWHCHPRRTRGRKSNQGPLELDWWDISRTELVIIN